MRTYRIYAATIIAVIAVMTMSGCKNSQRNEADRALGFPIEETHQWSYITTDEVIPLPNDLLVSDSSIYIVGHMGGYWLHEFKKDSPSEAVSTIRAGQGPAEVINAFGMIMSDDGKEKTIFDFNTRSFKTYDNNYNVIKQVDLKSLKVNISDAWLLKGDRCLISSLIPLDGNVLPLRTYMLADIDSMNIITRCDSFDESRLRYLPNLMRQSRSALSPDGNNFAVGTSYGGIIEFFNLSDTTIKQSFFKVLIPYEIPTEGGWPIPDENPLFGFTALCATNELVYGAFLGSTDYPKPTDIGVWKWNGEPVKLIHTDATVLALDIDEKTNTLYAVTFNQETEPRLAKMKL